MTVSEQTYSGYRFPIEIISHSIWLYHRFMLSLRDVTEILLSRGIKVSHESIRDWGFTFGHEFAMISLFSFVAIGCMIGHLQHKEERV